MATQTLPTAARVVNKPKRSPPAILTVSEEADVMVYSSPNPSGAEYEIVLRSPDVGTDSCTCPSGVAGKRCRHITAAWRVFIAGIKRYQAHKKAAPTCPCCRDKTDLNNECACWCLPDPNLPSCTNQPGCLYAAAKTLPPLSPTLEAELAELVAERELEADPFHRG